MRLDSHVHIASHEVIANLHNVVTAEGITHYVAIINDLDLIEHLDESGARGIPFYRLKQPLSQSICHDLDKRVAGFKLHLRHPVTKNKEGEALTISEKHMGRICDAAAHSGRPLLFHTDADEPEICSLPMLAELARRHPQTIFIAAHTGVLTQEYQGKRYEPKLWQAICEGAVRQNLRLLCEIENLFADTALLGSDYPERSPDPDFKLNLFVRVVEDLGSEHRKTLVDKLFVGTDFPCYWDPNNVRTGYSHQIDCLRKIFKQDFDVNRMSQNFLNLLHRDSLKD